MCRNKGRLCWKIAKLFYFCHLKKLVRPETSGPYYVLTHSFTHSLTHSLTYLLTPWNRFLFEKLTGFQLVRKFPAFYGTRRSITAFRNARHLSLSWASSIQSTSSTTHRLKIHLNIIIASVPGSFKWSLSLRFPHHNPVHTSPLSHTCYIPSSSQIYTIS